VRQQHMVSSSYRVSRVSERVGHINVLATFNSTMFGAINVKASDDRARTEGLRHTTPMGGGIETEDVWKNDFNEHS
jgi:hypothetical protein